MSVIQEEVTPGVEPAFLPTGYQSDDRVGVLAFLRTHPGTSRILQEALPHIQAIFGQDSPVLLRVVRDYEATEPEMLFADIQVRCSPQEAFTKINAFEDGWWLDVQRPWAGLLQFDVQFR